VLAGVVLKRPDFTRDLITVKFGDTDTRKKIKSTYRALRYDSIHTQGAWKAVTALLTVLIGRACPRVTSRNYFNTTTVKTTAVLVRCTLFLRKQLTV
jgi:predicted subunit of tRNA(5-methylaminomethyl-2-thiouridylate) methyltransferase